MKFLRYNLWQAKRRLSPKAAFRRALWQKLAGAWGNRYVKISWYQAHLVRLASAGTIGVLVAGSFGTGAYAYVSPEVTEDSILYPVKQKLEAVEERVFNRTPEAKAKFYLKQIARREAEAAVLVRHGRAPEQLEERLEKAEEKLVALQAQFTAAAKEKQQALSTKIQARLAVRRERLEQQAARLKVQLERAEPEDDGDKITTSTAAAMVAAATPDQRVARRAKREEKFAARLKIITERLEQLPAMVSSSATATLAIPPNSPSSTNLLIPIRRIEKIKERLERRAEQLDNQLEKRLEKLDEKIKAREFEVRLRP